MKVNELKDLLSELPPRYDEYEIEINKANGDILGTLVELSIDPISGCCDLIMVEDV